MERYQRRVGSSLWNRGDDVALQMVVVSDHLYMFNAKRILRLLVGGGGECKEPGKGLCLILDGG